MRYVQLSDVLSQAKTVRAGHNTFPVLSMTMRDGLVPQNHKFKKSVSSADLSGYKVVRRGQLVVGFPIDEGVLSFQQLHESALVSPAYGIWDLRNPEQIHAPYLEKYLRSPRALAYYKAKLRGSTARRRSLPLSSFTAMPLPLPELAEQQRLVDILDKADALRTQRREAIAHLDSLGQSIFHEMFESSSKRECQPLGEVLRVASGKFLPSKNMVLGGHYPVYGGNGINGYHDDYFIEEPTVVIGRVGANCGAVHLTQEKSWVTDNALRVTKLVDVENLFLLYALTRLNLNQYANVSGQPSISGSVIYQVPIALPTLDRQRIFGKRITEVGRLRDRYSKQVAELDNLFLSLQDRAFKGEL